MTLNPVSNLMTFCKHEFHNVAQSCKTASEKAMNFAEEMTFFFKNRNVKPMPDTGLMLVLQKDKTRRKKRRVAKMDGSQGVWMMKKQPEHNPDAEDDSDSIA